METLVDLYGPCAWCGCGAAQCGPVCLECSEAYEVLRASLWPVSLGHAIARFLRRERVRELEHTVGERFYDAIESAVAMHAAKDETPQQMRAVVAYDEARIAARDALDELAAMAMDESWDG